MREFVVLGHDAPTDPEFSLDDLPGAGRLDLLARCVTNGLLRSHGIRADARVHLVLADEYTVTFEGNNLRNLHPDERSTAALVRTALSEREEAIGHVPVETSPGVSLSRMGTEATLESVASAGQLIQLHEAGTAAGETQPPSDPVFVLSDHHEFRAEEAELLAELGAQQLSFGPVAVHAGAAVTLANHWVDTDGYRTG